MAIIYSYPEIGTLATGDLMPISDISANNATKSVTLTKLGEFFNTVVVANLTDNFIPVFNGAQLVDSIIKQSAVAKTISVGSLPATGPGSIQAKIYGGLEIEPSQPDFGNDAQFSVLSDNQGTGSPEPKIMVPSNYDRLGINATFNNVASSNHALLIQSGFANGSGLLQFKSDNDLVKITFSTETGSANNSGLILYKSNPYTNVLSTIGFSPDTNPTVDNMPMEVRKLSFNLTGGLNKIIVLNDLPAYADDAAATADSLPEGSLYQTDGSGTAPLNVEGIVMIKQ